MKKETVNKTAAPKKAAAKTRTPREKVVSWEAYDQLQRELERSEDRAIEWEQCASQRQAEFEKFKQYSEKEINTLADLASNDLNPNLAAQKFMKVLRTQSPEGQNETMFLVLNSLNTLKSEQLDTLHKKYAAAEKELNKGLSSFNAFGRIKEGQADFISMGNTNLSHKFEELKRVMADFSIQHGKPVSNQCNKD